MYNTIGLKILVDEKNLHIFLVVMELS